MEEKIINAIKELTGSKKIFAYDELGEYVANKCSKKNDGKFYSSNLYAYEISDGEYQGSIQVYAKEYCIFKKHIEEKDKNEIPFLVEFYEIDILNSFDEVLDSFYMI